MLSSLSGHHLGPLFGGFWAGPALRCSRHGCFRVYSHGADDQCGTGLVRLVLVPSL